MLVVVVPCTPAIRILSHDFEAEKTSRIQDLRINWSLTLTHCQHTVCSAAVLMRRVTDSERRPG